MEVKTDNVRKLSFRNNDDLKNMESIGVALSSFDRICILQLIADKSMTLSEIAQELHIAISSVSYHVAILEKSGFLGVGYKPSKKGHVKICYSLLRKVEFSYDAAIGSDSVVKYVEHMPVGYFVDCEVKSPCGIANDKGRITVDTPTEMFVGGRGSAQLLWFSAGNVSYNFPNHYKSGKNGVGRISLSFEVCSEASAHRLDWPSDITVWINDVEVATYTCPSDFGGRRGRYTPKYWSINSTQFGELKTFSVDKHGAYVDGTLVNSDVNIHKLKLDKKSYIKVTIGIKDNAEHVGGVNLFGAGFGDYPQDIILTLSE